MSIAAAKNAGPGPCTLQDPFWVNKMSGISGNNTKKRKKSDVKSQSQLNKCLNEKRRRTTENNYIEEIHELIRYVDIMNPGKTDKCQILQKAVAVLETYEQNGYFPYDNQAVQQREVSSSNSLILDEIIGSAVLEALNGFIFIVNSEGRVEFVTENISEYINFSKEDVLGKDIYNIIHHGDHQCFLPNILPESVGPDQQEDSGPLPSA